MKSNNIFNRKGKLYPFGAILTICMIMFASTLEAKNFDLTPLRNGFFGSVIIDSTIIVYGDFGVIYRSTDLGTTWKMHLIGEDAIIRRMENFNDTLWGILEKGSIIRSTNKGETWEILAIDVPRNERFYWLLIDSNYFYIRCDSSILKLDRNLKLLKSITNEFLKIRWIDIYCDCTLLSRVKFPTPIKFFFVFDKIVVPIRSSNTSLVESFCVIDKELNNLNLVTISDKIPKQKDENYLALVDIFYFDNTYTFQFIPRYGLFKTDSTFENWQWFFKDPSFLNYTFEDSTLRWQNYNRVSRSSLFTDNTTLYGIYSEMVKHIVDTIGSFKNLFNKICIKKYKSQPQDTFIVIGNPFKDIFFATVEYNYNYKLVNDIIPNHLLLPNVTVSNNTAVFTSNNPGSYLAQDKFILLSRNQFSEWDFVNLVQGQPFYILNDSTFFFVKELEIYRTFNSGITFKPFEAYTEGDTDSYIPGHLNLRRITQMYIDSSGKGVLLGIPRNPFPTKTYNFFKNIEHPVSIPYYESIRSYPNEYPTNISFIEDQFLFGFYDTSRINFRYKIYVGDSSFLRFKFITLDSLFAPMYLVPRTIKDFLAIGLANFNSDTTFEIRNTTDTGHTWTTPVRLINFGKINQIYAHNQDSVFITFTQPDRVYLYDRTRDTLQLLWQPETDEGQNPLLMVISDRFYLVGKGLFLENTDRSDLTQWREGEWDYGKPNFESVIFKSNVAIAGLSDSLRPFNYYKITLKKQTPSVVQEQLEKRYYTTKFWASEPYPQPAGVRVKARIAWDGSFDVAEAIDGVYDSMGRKVEGKERIRVTIRDKAYGELEWECSGMPAGVYFILLRWAGGSESVPVVVE
ncbi:hypothetical protein D9V84_10350 [Bacteroidetes/Chlorobi group bacterium Naka2016]|nr:MAG: hypothetical protein D9V84_10350 [Bacteroidetes/Chlorobi group bacterium Naka2016]